MLRTIITSIVLYFISQYIVIENGSVIPKKKEYILYNFLSIFCLYSFLNIFIWEYEINFLIVITLIYILSLVMYYVHEFRGTNLNFSDILSINTAKEVASGYKYEIKPFFILFFLFIILEFVFHIFIIKVNVFRNFHISVNGVESDNIDKYRFFWHELSQIILFLISFFVLKDKISKEKYDYSLFAGETEGYIYNFVSSIPLFHRNKGQLEETILAARIFIENAFNLERDKNEKYQSMVKYKNFARLEVDSPHVIVIMNESFGSIHRKIKTNLPVTPYYDSLVGAIKGDLYVNTFGGGTANTEFEFLTGMTIGNYEYPVMPYNNFVKRYKYSLARYFSNLGYRTVGMHPYTASNYHRDKVYKYFGFDETVFIDGIKNKQYVRNFISDDSMYDEVVRRYKMCKANDQKIFLFGVTVQNHSGYGDFKEKMILTMTRNSKNRDDLDNYMSLMRISDNALKHLIDYFEGERDHVIILFFGDHNASFGTEINKAFYGDDINYEFSDAYSVPFLIYDNKYKEDSFIKMTSANFLSIELLKKARLPFDMLHHTLNKEYETYKAFNYHKAMNRDNAVTNIPFDEMMKLEKEYLKR